MKKLVFGKLQQVGLVQELLPDLESNFIFCDQQATDCSLDGKEVLI